MQAKPDSPEIIEQADAHSLTLNPQTAQVSIPRGHSLMEDIKRELPDFSPGLIFDVGANVGACAREYALSFPSAAVYCFEPIATTFPDLERNVEEFANCRCFELGFSDEPGTVNMRSNLSHPNRSYVIGPSGEGETEMPSSAIVQVKMDTVDRFCSESGIEEIGLLKIDTEGYDMRVLMGARGLLEKKGIRIIVVEAGMYAGNERHVPFMDLCRYLENFDFVLFGIYDQCREWVKDLPYLRRADLAFIKQ
jgi:FkbM family methyltransferase